ncbi:CAP domain-containing protein [Loktanella sp. M215]|nr:CAP domain-containing protein [Loktanella sp. M215]
MPMFRTLIAAFLLAMTAQTAAASNACAMPANANQMASQIAAGVNASRQANGLKPLRYNQTLSKAAMAHACDMSVHNFFGHTGSNGSHSQGRVRAVGYKDCTVAENLAWGYPKAGQIIGGWMHSAGHRSNMLHPRVTEMGIGITEGAKGPNWVLVLARSC